MIRGLCNKIIYEDFREKERLTKDEIKVLDMLLQKETLISIANSLNMSDRNVSRIIKSIKNKYEDYKKIETVKYEVFMSE